MKGNKIMANTRRELKPYKGYPITKVNEYRYVSYDPKDGQFESNSLDGIKKRIDDKIGIRKLSFKLGELLLPKKGF